MPRGQKRAAAIKALEKSQRQAFDDDEESEWEQEDEHQSQSSSDNYKQDSVVDDKHDTKPPAKKKKNKQRKPTLMDSQDYNVSSSSSSSSSSNDDESQHHRDDDLLPSYARKTAKGGYAHTWKSRARISKANKGNTPWNKGKNRSEGVKAKIAAGVRARNRKVLLEKLKKLNMTEEEWLAKKKEIKYLRERIRKAKKAAEAREAQKLRKGKDADKSYEELEKELSAKLQAKVQSMQLQGEMTKTPPPSNKPKSDADRSSKEEMLEKIFTPHVAWTRHDYDTHDGLYEQLCPTGGPGGLACCHACSFAYSNFLNQTSQDLDVQATHNAATEVQECLQFMQETRDKLQTKMKIARTQAVPLKRHLEKSMTGISAASV